MSELLVRTDPLGGSPLARAAMDGALPAWYPGMPTSAASWRVRADEVRQTASRNWTEALGDALGATGGPGATVVVVVVLVVVVVVVLVVVVGRTAVSPRTRTSVRPLSCRVRNTPTATRTTIATTPKATNRRSFDDSRRR